MRSAAALRSMSADDLARIAVAEKEALEVAANAAFLDRRRRVRVERIESFVKGYCEEHKDDASLRAFENLPEGKRNRLAYVSSREFVPALTAETLRGWHAGNFPGEAEPVPEVQSSENKSSGPRPVQDGAGAEFPGLAEESAESFRAQGVSRDDIPDSSPADWREIFTRVGARVRARKWAGSHNLLGAVSADTVSPSSGGLGGSPAAALLPGQDGKHASSLLGLEAAVGAFAAPRDSAPPDSKLREALQDRGLADIAGASLLPTDAKSVGGDLHLLPPHR